MAGEAFLPQSPSSPWPRGLADGLPFVWQKVLFPGVAGIPGPVPVRSLLMLVVLPALVLYTGLSFPLFDPDEGRYAEIPREMQARGEWVVPYLQGEPYLDKPPLFYWLVRLSYAVWGVHDGAARLVPALAAHATILLTYLFGRRVVGERAAFWGAVLLGLAPAFGLMSRLVLLDGLLAFFTTLTLFALGEAIRGPAPGRGWWLLAGVAAGLGILTKGPVILVLAVPPVWAHAWLSGARARPGAGGVAVFLAAALGVAVPWYVAVGLRLPGFARYFLWEHNVLRFLAPFDHLEPAWYYGPVVLLGLLPGSLLLPALGRWLWTNDESLAERRTAGLGFVLLASAWCVLFFSASGSKLATYVLPAFPFLALAVGATLAARDWDRRRSVRAAAVGTLGVMAAVHLAGVPWFAGQRAAMGRPAPVLELCSDPDVPVLCFPRPCDSVAFYLGRDDVRPFRSKEVLKLVEQLREKPRTVVLCTHRHTLTALKQALSGDLRVVREVRVGPSGPWADRVRGWSGETALGLCDVAVIERGPPPGPVAARAGGG